MGYRSKERARPQGLLANGQRLRAKAHNGSNEIHQRMAAQKEIEKKGRRPVDQEQKGRPASLESWLHDDVPGSQNADTAVSSLSSSGHPTIDKEPKPDNRQPVLIIVEDNKDDFVLLKRALWKSGATARVWWAHDAAEALSMLTELESSRLRICIVADLQLPVVSGLELLDLVKAEPCHSHVKLALLTGCNDPSTESRAFAKGADAFFVKPAQAENLTEVARALQRLVLAANVNVPRAQPDLRVRDG